VKIYGYAELYCSVISKTRCAIISIAAIILGALPILVPLDVEGSEVRITPGIILSEEYNDNVFLATKNRSDDYITGIAPSLSLFYSAPNWDLDAAYNYNYRVFAKKTIRNESYQSLNLTNKNRIISGFFFLDVKDQYQRVSLDVIRDYTQESNFVNQTDMNQLIINPYFVLKPSSRMTVTTGYIYMDTWYKDPLAIKRKDHIGYADVTQDISLRSAIVAGVRYTSDINTVEGYTQNDLYLGSRVCRKVLDHG
jgi:uncharacterized protein (PEP-CTERM system associated)